MLFCCNEALVSPKIVCDAVRDLRQVAHRKTPPTLVPDVPLRGAAESVVPRGEWRLSWPLQHLSKLPLRRDFETQSSGLGHPGRKVRGAALVTTLRVRLYGREKRGYPTLETRVDRARVNMFWMAYSPWVQ